MRVNATRIAALLLLVVACQSQKQVKSTSTGRAMQQVPQLSLLVNPAEPAEVTANSLRIQNRHVKVYTKFGLQLPVLMFDVLGKDYDHVEVEWCHLQTKKCAETTSSATSVALTMTTKGKYRIETKACVSAARASGNECGPVAKDYFHLQAKQDRSKMQALLKYSEETKNLQTIAEEIQETLKDFAKERSPARNEAEERFDRIVDSATHANPVVLARFASNKEFSKLQEAYDQEFNSELEKIEGEQSDSKAAGLHLVVGRIKKGAKRIVYGMFFIGLFALAAAHAPRTGKSALWLLNKASTLVNKFRGKEVSAAFQGGLWGINWMQSLIGGLVSMSFLATGVKYLISAVNPLALAEAENERHILLAKVGTKFQEFQKAQAKRRSALNQIVTGTQ